MMGPGGRDASRSDLYKCAPSCTTILIDAAPPPMYTRKSPRLRIHRANLLMSFSSPSEPARNTAYYIDIPAADINSIETFFYAYDTVYYTIRTHQINDHLVPLNDGPSL